MRVRAPAVVAGWGLLNGALAATLAGFGEASPVVILYGAASALVLLAAGGTWLARHRGRAGRSRRPARADSVLLLAAAILLACLGVAFGWLLALTAVIPLILAVAREISIRRGSA